MIYIPVFFAGLIVLYIIYSFWISIRNSIWEKKEVESGTPQRRAVNNVFLAVNKLNIMNHKRYKYYAVRVDTKKYQISDRLVPSLDIDSGIQLYGTCGISIQNRDGYISEQTILLALSVLSVYPSTIHYGNKLFGDNIHIIAGNEMIYGKNIGEVEINDAVVVGVIDEKYKIN